MHYLRIAFTALLLVVGRSASSAETDDAGGMAYAEQALQSYLAMWSSNAGITADNVGRFYAPHVIYYGKMFSRADVLADKQAYIKSWPVRVYRELPGTFTARCNTDRSLCHVSAVMAWRRVSSQNVVASGRARISFDFVPADGARKIVRESAKMLPPGGYM